MVDALFDPAAMPDILAELAVSDEANRRAVNVQVVQRRGAGIVRGIANSPIDALPRGSTVLNSGHHARTPFNAAQFEQMVRLLVGPTSGTAGLPKFLETGIKVIDVMCPLVAGGTLAIATDIGAGVMVLMEELVRRLSGGCDPLSIFVMMPPPSPERPDVLEPEPGFSHAEQLRKRATAKARWAPSDLFPPRRGRTVDNTAPGGTCTGRRCDPDVARTRPSQGLPHG